MNTPSQDRKPDITAQMRGARLKATPFDPRSQEASWFALEGSLTQAIETSWNAPPAVTVLSEGQDLAAYWEQNVLGCNDNIFARHITLGVANQVLVAARSVTDWNSSGMHAIKALGRRPLAQLLFQDARWRRQGNPIALTAADKIAGRACLWAFSGEPAATILVEEFFFPELLSKQAIHAS